VAGLEAVAGTNREPLRPWRRRRPNVSNCSLRLVGSPTSFELQGTMDSCQVSGTYMGTVRVSGSGGGY